MVAARWPAIERAPPDRSAAGRRNVRQLLSRFDRDGDGQLQRERSAAAAWPTTSTGSTSDANGKLDRDELQQVAGRQAAARVGVAADGPDRPMDDEAVDGLQASAASRRAPTRDDRENG